MAKGDEEERGSDVLSRAEGMAELREQIAKGPPAKAKIGRCGDVKASWKPTNVRMDPGVKERMKSKARALGVPLEELVHVALTRFLAGLDEGEIELKTRAATVRRTLL